MWKLHKAGDPHLKPDMVIFTSVILLGPTVVIRQQEGKQK
jgi:hypothetical protein